MKFNKINILYPIVTLVLIFFILMFNLIKNDFKEYHSLTTMKNNVFIATQLSSIVNELQIERGLSITYLVSKNKKFLTELSEQRKKTDTTLITMANRISKETIHPQEIQNIRKKIDQHTLSSSQVLTYYSNINDKLLSAIVRMAQSSTSPEVTRKLNSYSNFLFAKELAGIQRALGTEIISSNKLNKDKILTFYSLIVRQKQYINRLMKYSPVEYKINYVNILDKKTQAKIAAMQNTILSLKQKDIHHINVKVLFTTLSKKINNLALFEEYISNEILKSIENRLANVTYTLKFNLFLNIASIFSFIFLILLIFRVIKNEKKLLKLTDEYIISSTTDTKGIITSVSQAFVDISGFSESELIGKSHNIVRYPDIPNDAFKELWRIIKNGKVWEGEVKNRKRDGGNYWVKSSIIPEYDRRNNIIGYTSLSHDISSEKAKEEFMANVSHELRTPLNSIIGFSDILHKKLKEASNVKYIDRVGSSAKVLLKLINDILDLSKIKNSKFTIEPYEFNAYEEVNQYSDTFKGLTSKKNVSLEVEIDTELQGIFFGDWMRISQIILNIISNAIKFTPKDGKVIFTAVYKDGNFVFSVQDNGIGMTKEVQNKIFLPFEQADGSTTRKYGGTGLGLSITQSLVELMRGNISLESQEGEGSTFTITIPLQRVKDDVNAEKSKVIEQQNSSKELFNDHVLVAEDNQSNQMLIELLLNEYGITCDLVGDGEEAVEKYNPAIHSFIFMDENMPKMNGLVAMQILKQKYAEKCGEIIALTANTMSGDKERFLELGMDNYLSKPIDNKELQKVLKLYAKPAEENSYIFKAVTLTKEKTNFSDTIVKKLLTSYFQSSLKLLESLQNAIKNSDFDSIRRAAHDMKSTSGSMNFTDIANLSQEMEKNAQEKKEADYMELYSAFKKHIELLEEYLV